MVQSMSFVRAIFLHRDLPFHGGVPKSFLTMAENNDPNRMCMHIGTFVPPDGLMHEAFASLGVKVHSLGDQYSSAIRRLRHILRLERIDVCVCGSFKAYVTAKAASVGLPCSVVFWIPGISLVIEGVLRKSIFRLLSRRDTLIYISEAVKAAHDYPAHKGRAEVIYHGISDPFKNEDLAPVNRDFRETLGIPRDARVIGYTAEFIALKDHLTLLRAFDEISKRLSDTHLVLIGTGTLFNEVREEAQRMPCANRVHFLGARRDARRLLGLFDIYAHVARGEGFGLAVAEAMLAGLPVVASNSGALPEFVIDGVTGVLFEVGNFVDLGEKLLTLLENETLRASLGASAREYCLERFSPKRFADQMIRVIEGELKMV